MQYTTSETPAGKRRWSKHDLRDSLREAVAIRQRHRCAYCNQLKQSGQIDHVVARVHGGSNKADNLVWACRSCNLSKSDKRLEDWLAKRPRALARVLAIIAEPVDRKAGLAAAKAKALTPRSRSETKQALKGWLKAA
jgi:hypothetical protein